MKRKLIRKLAPRAKAGAALPSDSSARGDGVAEVSFRANPEDPPIEIFPYGFTMANGPSRPVLVFKDKTGRHVLPVWVHPLDATMALHEHASTPIEPHGAAAALLSQAGITVESCEFDEVAGHRQYAALRFRASQASENAQLRVRADQAMSFCLALGARFFSSPGFMARCRDINGKLDGLAERIEAELEAVGTPANAPENGSNNPSYMM